MRTIKRLVQDGFFSLLSSPSRELYLDCLLLLMPILSELNAPELTSKSAIISKIRSFLSIYRDTTVLDDENPLSEEDKASFLYRQLVAKGWIYEEATSTIDSRICFYPHALEMLNLFIGLGESSIEYSGFVSSVDELVRQLYSQKDRLTEEAVGIFEKIVKETTDFSQALQVLDSGIYQHYRDLLTQEIEMGTLADSLGQYNHQFLRSLEQFMKSDFVTTKRSHIFRSLLELSIDSSFFFSLSELFQKTKQIDEKSAHGQVNKLQSVVEFWQQLMNRIQSIFNHNNSYTETLSQRISYFLNQKKGLEGDLIENLNLAYGGKARFPSFECFSTFSLDSLYIPPQVTNQIAQVNVVDIDERTQNELTQKALTKIRESQKYSLEKINKYVLSHLNGKDSMMASELDLSSFDSYVYLLLIMVYASNSRAHYETVWSETKVTVQAICFPNFLIRRRQHANTIR